MSTSSIRAARELQELDKLIDDLFMEQLEDDKNGELFDDEDIVPEEFDGLLVIYAEIKFGLMAKKAEISSSGTAQAVEASEEVGSVGNVELVSTGAADSAESDEGNNVANAECPSSEDSDASLAVADNQERNLFKILVKLAKEKDTVDDLGDDEIETLEVVFKRMKEDLRQRLPALNFMYPDEGTDEESSEEDDDTDNTSGFEEDDLDDASSTDEQLDSYDVDQNAEAH